MKTHRVTLSTPIHAAALRSEVSMLMVRMKPQPTVDDPLHFQADIATYAPYAPGDLIACREPWWETVLPPRDPKFIYRADWGTPPPPPYRGGKWQPASRMPLAACRLWFRVQAVEARRVADVTEEEAREMGYREHANCPASYWLPDDLGQWAWKLKVERTER